MKKLSMFLLLVFPFYFLNGDTPQTPAQPRVYINQGLDYPYGYYGLPTSTEVKGNTVIQNYSLPPQQPRLQSPVKPQNRTPPSNKAFYESSQSSKAKGI
jgi:hypothetical protein